ncbi:pyridoxamine 5'-phosphate oxidase family protein [Okeania sp. SIO2C9]|uniref:pyridoxamine 5'-phosphate oxidase family protein n=1 Tax=Okeania sp. SIO2C9 TaxID=2607791 RepID=UPI0025FE4E34|nr:pyridoxamine 5'-phosphate oxidase family protein [Okeania sp. SIO2C9]
MNKDLQPSTASNGWVNTLESDKFEVYERAKQIIDNNLYCVLSTCSITGEPWCSPVFFAYDESWHLYWFSAVASRHSQNIYHNQGKVAIAIFNSAVPEGTGIGLYFQGTADECREKDQIERALVLLRNRASQPENRPYYGYLGDSARRIYCFFPHQAWVSGERLEVGNQTKWTLDY